MLAIAATVVAIACAGCAAPPPTKISSSLETGLDAYLNSGRNTVRGQGFLRQRGGTVVTCAGAPVMMMPNTAFFQEVMRIGMAGGKPDFAGVTSVDPKYRGLLFKSQCDAQGNFTFAGVPDGSWIVATEVTWSAGRYSSEGGIVQQTVFVSGNQTAQVLVTR